MSKSAPDPKLDTVSNLLTTDWYGNLKERSIRVSLDGGIVTWSPTDKDGRTFRQAMIDTELEKAKKGKIIDI